jgi:type II secretory pathway pseudopilin PulG
MTRRDRGTSLVEIMVSLMVVLVGMLALFRTLGTSVTGSMTASRMTQAQQRAVLVAEAMRVAPPPALTCLAGTKAAGWDACELTCLAYLTGPTKSRDACVYKNLNTKQFGGTATLALDQDGTQQRYDVVTKSDKGGPVASVTTTGMSLTAALYEFQIVVGWNDANTAADKNPDHYVVLRSGVYAP